MNCSATITGKQHLCCQDSALVTAFADHAIAIVSDGCSSSENSEIGSAFIALLAKRALSLQPNIEFADLLNYLSVNIYPHVSLQDCKTMFDATLVYATLDHVGNAFVRFCGDGVVFLQTNSGEYISIHVDYHGNAPCYPSYFIFGLYGFYDSSTHPFDCSIRVKRWTEKFQLLSQETYSEKISSFSIPDVKRVYVFSDGIKSFFQNNEFGKPIQPIDFMDVFKEIVDCPYYGSKNWLNRHLRQLSLAWRKKNIVHIDDFSVSYIKKP